MRSGFQQTLDAIEIGAEALEAIVAIFA
jgi:hypothetical protein